MANVIFTVGLKMIGDRASAVASAAAAIAGMSADDRTAGFANTDTTCSTGGAPTNFQGNALDATPIGPAAATPYVVPHLMTLTTSQLNTVTVKRFALHNTASPLIGGSTIISGIDGLSLLKQSGFALTTTFKHSYS